MSEGTVIGQGHGRREGRRGRTRRHGSGGLGFASSRVGELLAASLVGALVLAGCTSDGDADAPVDDPELEIDEEPVAEPIDPDDVVLVVATHADALEAMADSIAAGSWRWTGGVEVSFTDDDLALVMESEDAPTLAEISEELDRLGASSARGALGEDGSWQTAWVHGGRDIVDVRMSGGELFDASTLDPEVTLLLRVDWPYILTEFSDELGYPGGPSPDEEFAEARREAEAWLEGSPFLDVVLAILDGDWGGLSGFVDLASFGMTEQDMEEAAEEFREELIGLADRDTTLELIDRSVTLRDFTPVGTDGGSVAVLDVHPEAAAQAIYDLFDDAADLAADHDDDLPETLEAVATITFDGDGMMTEVSTDVLAIVRQIAELELESGGPDASGITVEDLELMSRIEGTIAVVFGFSDHGRVPTVLDVPNAVTADWGELAEMVAGMFAASARDEVGLDCPEWPDCEADPDDRQAELEGDTDEGDGSIPGTDPEIDPVLVDPDEYWVCLEEGGSFDDCDPLLDR